MVRVQRRLLQIAFQDIVERCPEHDFHRTSHFNMQQRNNNKRHSYKEMLIDDLASNKILMKETYHSPLSFVAR